jgi:DNA-binding transcriptional LysR family regulator
MESALELARRQMAVAYLPHFVVELHNKTVMPKFRLKEIPLVGKGVRTNPVYLIKRKNDPESTLMKKLAKVIRTNIF